MIFMGNLRLSYLRVHLRQQQHLPQSRRVLQGFDLAAVLSCSTVDSTIFTIHFIRSSLESQEAIAACPYQHAVHFWIRH